MNDNMDVKTWKAYCELYEKIGKKIDEDMMQVFDNGIKCFSSYLCHANAEYVYSTTYLQQFNKEFWEFIKCFYEKYKLVDELFSIGEKYSNVSIKIDKYWLLETDEKGESNRRTLSGPDSVCDSKIKIECAVLHNMKRYIYRQIYEMNDIDSELKEIRKGLKLFLDKYSSKDPKEISKRK